MRNLSLGIKRSFSKINSAFFCPALFYSTFISAVLKIAFKIFKRMLLIHCFNGFFPFLNWFFKAFLLNWLTNLRAQFGLYRKRAEVWTPWKPPFPNPPRCACVPGLAKGSFDWLWIWTQDISLNLRLR